MPLCGFNKKMLEGLNAFNEGLVEHGLIFRGKQNSETIDQGIKRELSDMTRLLPELLRLDDVPKRLITQGIVTYVMGFYLIMRKNNLDKTPEKYKDFIEKLNIYFYNMDNKYYGELEGMGDDMKKLVEYLDKLEI